MTIPNIKYEVHNQLTGLNEEAYTFEDAKILSARLKEEYMVRNVNDLFLISVLVQNEDGSWTQGLADSEGGMVQPEPPSEEEIAEWRRLAEAQGVDYSALV